MHANAAQNLALLRTHLWYRMLAKGHVDGRDLGVELKTEVPAFAADAALLGAAKGRAQVAHVVRVDPHHPGLDRLRNAVRAAEVARPDVAGQPVLDVIR